MVRPIWKRIPRPRVPRRRRALALAAALLPILAGVSAAWAGSSGPDAPRAARQITDTPVPLIFPTNTITPAPSSSATRTATVTGRPVIEAMSADTNVRAGPDINETAIGKINPGTQYPVTGKRFDWYQIEYPDVPNQIGWVYSGVVTLTGDPAAIAELDPGAIPTVDPALISGQQTATAVGLTPGGAFTLTAQAAVTSTVVLTPGDSAATLDPSVPLPTYTNPPYTPTPVIIPESAPANVETDSAGIPPIVPILALGALGLMGLLVSLLRRL